MAKKQAVNGERGRWSAKAKREAVLRLLRGEAIDTLSRELKVTAAKLSEWHLAKRRRVRIDLGDGHATKARVVARPEQDEAVQGLAVQGAIAGHAVAPLKT